MTKILALIAAIKADKVYLAAAGLIGLSLFQASQGQYSAAGQTFLSALTALGLRSAIVAPTPAPAPAPIVTPTPSAN